VAINIDADGALEISHELEQELLVDEEFYTFVKQGNFKEACARASVILQDMLDNIVV